MAPFPIPSGDIDVLTVGEALVDFLSEDDTEWLREAETFRRHLGGSPANIALYVAKLGGTAAVVAKTGIGAFGTFIKAQLRANGVSDRYLIMDHRVHTSLVFVSRTTATPEFEVLRRGDYQLTPAEIDEEAVASARVVHASTFALSRPPCRDAVRRAFELAHDHGKLVSFDPNYSPVVWPEYEEARRVIADTFQFADLTKPSLDDCRRLFGDDAQPEDYPARFHEWGPQLVVLTMGRDGILISDDGAITHVPAHAVEVKDATAAGDSFWAGFLVALLDGHPLDVCARFARNVVERKLATVGHVEGPIDKAEIHAAIRDD